jgi:single-strand DNA-binding protein
MNDPNRVTLLGNVGSDPIMNEKGTVAKFSVATSTRWRDESGEMQSRTQWHTAKAFNALANIVKDTVQKGSRVYLEGESTYNDWTDKNGSKRHDAEIVMQDMQVVANRKTPAPS